MQVPTDTLSPTDVPVAAEESTQTPPTPSSTTTPEPQAPIVGGADKIAFIDQNEIWFVNVDGTDLEQITNDAAVKTDLRWLTDGSAFTYISGSCAWMIEFESKTQQQIACFETGELKSFSPSPDGELVAISLSNELFIVPFDIETLNTARFRSDLVAMSDCEPLNPLTTGTGASVPVKSIEWSVDDQRTTGDSVYRCR